MKFVTIDSILMLVLLVLLSVLMVILFVNAGKANKDGEKVPFILRNILGIVVLIITVSVVGSMGYVFGQVSDISMLSSCRKPTVKKEYMSFIRHTYITTHNIAVKTNE